MLGKRLSLPLGAVLLAGLAFGPGPAAVASTAQHTPKTVVSTAQDVATSTNTPNLVKTPPDPDRRRHHRYDTDHRHHRYHHRHHRYERDHRHHRHHRYEHNFR